MIAGKQNVVTRAVETAEKMVTMIRMRTVLIAAGVGIEIKGKQNRNEILDFLKHYKVGNDWK